jgi:hypothetical protein
MLNSVVFTELNKVNIKIANLDNLKTLSLSQNKFFFGFLNPNQIYGQIQLQNLKFKLNIIEENINSMN